MKPKVNHISKNTFFTHVEIAYKFLAIDKIFQK